MNKYLYCSIEVSQPRMPKDDDTVGYIDQETQQTTITVVYCTDNNKNGPRSDCPAYSPVKGYEDRDFQQIPRLPGNQNDVYL